VDTIVGRPRRIVILPGSRASPGLQQGAITLSASSSPHQALGPTGNNGWGLADTTCGVIGPSHDHAADGFAIDSDSGS